MERKLFFPAIVLIFSLFHFSGWAQSGNLVTATEAESGIRLGGVQVATSIAGYSGSGYIGNLRNSTDGITIVVTVPDTAFYSIYIRYYSTDNKFQYVDVNQSGASSVSFPKSNKWALAHAGKYLLNAGENTITLKSSWGWTEIDQFLVYTTELNSYERTTSKLVDSQASGATVGLYNYLMAHYRTRVISGQTDDNFGALKTITGQTPLYRTWDFGAYTAGYPYMWANGGHVFGIDYNARKTEEAIAWYNSTGKKGIVGFHWHWHSPSGGKAGTNTFYTEYTTFDVRKAVTPGTAEYDLIIRDIDAIAVQLKKLETANVPILWRPLHEAGGGWFWWGAKGAEPCKKLWDIVFERINNYHQIHNLIWVWSTPETDWYPGNDKVDIVGHDSYPGLYNYGTQKNMFDTFLNLSGGTKIVSMSENGPIPNIDDCLKYDAPWLLFMSWNDLVQQQNSNDHLIEVFNHPKVLVMENDTFPRITAVTHASVCDSGEVILRAESNMGVVRWFADSIGGEPIHEGTSFAVPQLLQSRTFYVEPVLNNRTWGIKRSSVEARVVHKLDTLAITGPDLVCQGAGNAQLEVLPHPMANSYVWTFPQGVKALGDATRSKVTIQVEPTASEGIIFVAGKNACGLGDTSYFQLNLSELPVISSEIDGPMQLCKGETNLSYRIDEVPGAVEYIWTIPSGFTGSSSTNEIVLNTSTAALSGELKVRAINECGAAAEKEMSITVNSIPTTPVVYLNSGKLESNSAFGNQWYFNDSILTDATNSNFTPQKSGEYFTVVTTNGCSSSPSNKVYVTVSSVNQLASGWQLRLYPNPISEEALELHLDADFNLEQIAVQICDVHGRLVYNGVVSNNQIQLNSPFLAGLYSAKIEVDGVPVYARLLVQP